MGRLVAIASGNVKGGAVFRHVDPGAPEHGFNFGGKLGFFGQLLKKALSFLGNPVFGKIEENVVEVQGKPLEPLRVGSEEIPHVDPCHFLSVLFECPPGRKLSRLCHFRLSLFFADPTKAPGSEKPFVLYEIGLLRVMGMLLGAPQFRPGI